MSLPTEPYTRIESYLAKLAGQDVDIPDKPITRIECYLAYLCDNGGGGGGGFTPAPNAGAHNGIFRGQSLGTELTAEQSAAIVGGTFDNLYIGDYWTIGGVVYRIAGFDLFYKGGSPTFTTHHAVILPDGSLYTGAMNETGTTSGGYKGSAMYTSGLIQGAGIIRDAFGDSHVIAFPTLITNQVIQGAPTSYGWVNVKIDLMSEVQALGCRAFGVQVGNGYNVGNKLPQFPLLALRPEFIIADRRYWLSDVVNDTSFSYVHSLYPGAITAETVLGVRPYFCIA